MDVDASPRYGAPRDPPGAPNLGGASTCCTTRRYVRSGIFSVMISKKLYLFKLKGKGKVVQTC